MTGAPEFDIRAGATEVVDLLHAGRNSEGLRLLEQHRHNQPEVIRDALDRFVAHDASTALQAARQPHGVPDADRAPLDATLRRLEAATAAPRFPTDGTDADQRLADGLERLTDRQRYDAYASIVLTRGNEAARDALERPDERVILGLRRESSTLIARDDPRTQRVEGQGRGAGEYDDRVVVLWTDRAGARRVEEFNRANTEPSAQYDHHAGSTGTRRFNHGGVEAQLAASAGYENVATRKIEGEDVNGDGLRDLGRLAEGTIQMQRATHPSGPGGRPEPALRPTPEAVAAGANGIQRDSNADGWFTAGDINGNQALNNTFKFHKGSLHNTDSAGCQTLHPHDYARFTTAVTANPTQTRWQYVLTSATPGMFRNVEAQFLVPENPAPLPAGREGAANRPPLTGAGVLQLDADHPLHRDAMAAVQRLNASLNINDERAAACMAGSLACLAKQTGFDRIDHALLSVQSDQTRAGEKVFIVQGDPADPAKRRAQMQTQDAIAVPVAESVSRLATLEQASPMRNQAQQLDQPEQQQVQKRAQV